MKILWFVVMFLNTLLLASLYHNFYLYESIIHFIMFMIFHFILTYALANLTDTSLPKFKTLIKDSCCKLIFLWDYVKDLVDDTPSPNLPNLNPIIPNPMPNSPSINPHSSHTYDGIQAIVQDSDVQDFFDLHSPLIHDYIKGKGKEISSKPMIPPYTSFTYKIDNKSPTIEALHDMYTTGYNVITKQGYEGLALGVNENGIKYPILITSKPYLHCVGFSKYFVKEGDVNHHPSLHKRLPTLTLGNSDVHQEVAKQVYVELMNSKKKCLNLY